MKILRAFIIFYLATFLGTVNQSCLTTFLGTNSLFVLTCRKAVNQSGFNVRYWVYSRYNASTEWELVKWRRPHSHQDIAKSTIKDDVNLTLRPAVMIDNYANIRRWQLTNWLGSLVCFVAKCNEAFIELNSANCTMHAGRIWSIRSLFRLSQTKSRRTWEPPIVTTASQTDMYSGWTARSVPPL